MSRLKIVLTINQPLCNQKGEVVELMEWPEDKPEEDGFYWAFAEAFSICISYPLLPVLIGWNEMNSHWSFKPIMAAAVAVFAVPTLLSVAVVAMLSMGRP